MPLTTGTKLGPYEVLAPAGAGGMGEVYRARDTRLGRDVAIKVLPPEVAADPERLRRFEQEARAVAALDHPNILAIHDIGAHEGAPYLVSEYLEGETLRERLTDGVLSRRKAVEYGLQVAHGLAAAHQKGIIHRDLKPENIFLTRDGRVKILDFGLAKTMVEAAASASGDAPTLLTAGGSGPTSPGMVLGTAGYMSPEQVRGQAADARSDIFSFGAVFYEMLSGRRAFAGESGIETMNAILKEEPPELAQSAQPIAPGLERIMRRCLEKRPEQRFQSASDLGFALEALSDSGTRITAAAPAFVGRSRTVTAMTVVALLVALLAAGAVLLRRPPAPARAMHFSIPMSQESGHFALSADGSHLAFVATDERTGRNQLHVQPVGSRSARLVVGTEDASYPFWSPDGTQVAFFASGYLKKVRLSGGLPQNLARVLMGRGGAWGSKGVIIYAPYGTGPLWRVSEDGSGAEPVTEPQVQRGDTTHRWPAFLPDGERFLFFGGSFDFGPDTPNGIYLASLNSREKKLLVRANSSAAYAEGGYLFYVDGRRRLVMQSFDASRAELGPEPHALAEEVGLLPQTLWGGFSVAANGTVVYSAGAPQSRSHLTWLERSGKLLGTVGEAGSVANPALSPDGRWLAVDKIDLNTNVADIWLYHLEQGALRRLTFETSEDTIPIWSRDGKHIAHTSNDGVFVRSVSGMEPKQIFIKHEVFRETTPYSWSPEGGLVHVIEAPADGMTSIVLVPRGDAKPRQLVSSKATLRNVQVSPDGRWMAYMSDESGQPEIYVTTFPEPSGKWQVSRGGGQEPRWRGDSRELFYVTLNGDLTAVTVHDEGGFSSGTPLRLFPLVGRPPISGTDVFTYDVSRDGNRFIVNRYVKPEAVPPLHIILHATGGTAR